MTWRHAMTSHGVRVLWEIYDVTWLDIRSSAVRLMSIDQCQRAAMYTHISVARDAERRTAAGNSINSSFTETSSGDTLGPSVSVAVARSLYTYTQDKTFLFSRSYQDTIIWFVYCYCYYYHSLLILSGHLWSLQYLTLFRPRLNVYDDDDDDDDDMRAHRTHRVFPAAM